jgi:hypothetical protein
MTREIINELKKYTLGKKNTEKIEISILQINRVIKALEQQPKTDVLDKIRAEIEQIEINGNLRDVECFNAGMNAALNVIDKYKAESEDKE